MSEDTLLKPKTSPEYRVDVYKIGPETQKKETLKQIVKEAMFYTLITIPWIREIDEWADRDKTGLMVNLQIDPKPAATILFRGEAEYLREMYIHEKPKTPISEYKFFSLIAEEFLHEHSMFKRGMVEDFLLPRVELGLSEWCELRDQAKRRAYRYESLVWDLRIYKAEEMLNLRFGHPDIKERVKRLMPLTETLEGRENLWLEAMLYLRSEGLPYYISKRACDKLAFSDGYSNDFNPDDPYIYREKEAYSIKRHLDSIKPLGNAEILKWKNENEALNKRVYEFEKLDWEQTQERKRFLRELKPILASWIRQGFTREYAVDQCRKAGYQTSLTADAVEIWQTLVNEGVRPDKTVIVAVKAKETEKPHESQAELDSEWISCMAAKSGAPDNEGHRHEAEPFDQAVERCTYTVFRLSGMQPSKNAFEKVKLFWEPGYWQNHEINDKGESFLLTEQRKAIRLSPSSSDYKKKWNE
jgi:hypothetical protein